MSNTSVRDRDLLARRISQCIEQARCSPKRYGSVDLFIGPYIGREVSAGRLRSLIEDIGVPQHYQSSQPVLAVKSTHGPTKGFLMIIGGGHRYVSSSRVLHGSVIPYKLVNFSGVLGDREELDIIRNKGIIAFHVESNEPRPQRYGFMEQVLLYDDLKMHWTRMEEERVSGLKGRKCIPHKMSHTKLFQFYESTFDMVGAKSRWAIEFLSRKDNRHVNISAATRRQYMSGADRLLEAGVVPYLSSLEQEVVAVFNRSSLHAVRNWSVDKIRKVVELWKVRRATGVKMRYQFSDKVGRDVDGKGRGRKPSQSVPTLDEEQKLEATPASFSLQPGGQGAEGEEAAPRTNEADFITTSSKGPGESKGQDNKPDTHAQSVQHELVKKREDTTMPEDDLGIFSGLDDIMSRLEKVVAPTQDGSAETGTGCTTSHVQQSEVARAESFIGKTTDEASQLVDQRGPDGTEPGMTSAADKSVLEKGTSNEVRVRILS